MLLGSGSTLVAAPDWTNPYVVQLDERTLTMDTKPWGQVQIPRRLVAGVILRPPRDPLERRLLIDRLQRAEPEDRATDVVYLKSGDRIRGRVKSLSEDLLIQSELGEQPLPADNVQAIQLKFVRATSMSTNDQDDPIWLGFYDGSLLRTAGENLESEEGQLSVRLWQEIELQCPMSSVSFFQNSLLYLSDLEPVNYRHVPYLDLSWPLGRDRNLKGGLLRSGGEVYLKGISLHSAARVVYRIPDGVANFAAQIALDDLTGSRGSVIFRVYLIRDGEWQEAFVSDVIRGGDHTHDILVDVTGADALTLVVDYADRGDELDHANWLDARFE